jgi:phenylacetic acid degradation operon negative regulatory protein
MKAVPRADRPTGGEDQDGVGGQRIEIGSARSLLLTLLGEFVRAEGGVVWTSTLLRVMESVGIAEKSARQAIARTNSAGWIEGRRVGKNSCWSLTDLGLRIIEEGELRVRSMGRNSSWDGRWLVVAISLPNSYRAQRKKLYRALSWAGFGNPMPGLWVTPHTERVHETRRVIRQLELAPFACAFAGTSLDTGLTDQELVDRSWNLMSVTDHYEVLLHRFGGLRSSTADELLSNHIQLLNAWQRVPFVDPGLPEDLLPPDWRGRKIAVQLELLSEQWGVAAHRYWKTLLKESPPCEVSNDEETIQ